MEENTEIILTKDQEQAILDLWNEDPLNPPGFKKITLRIFGQELKGSSKEGRAIKAFLSRPDVNLQPKTAADDVRGEVELSEAHIAYITNNAKSMTGLDMAREIFHNPHLTGLHAETRAINAVLKGMDSKVIYNAAAIKDIPEKTEYVPPTTIPNTFKLIARYVDTKWDKDKLTATQKKCVLSLMGYLNIHLFKRQMDNYTSQSDRDACEDVFVRNVYDKPDLLQEEINQYIELANQHVQSFNIQRRSEKLQALLEAITGTDPENMKFSMSFIEAIDKTGKEYHQCEARKITLTNNLTQKRSARLEKQLEANASVLNLVQAWKQAESRKEMLMHAEDEQKGVALEVEKLTSLPEMKARILGLTKEEILNG